jgi:sugar phosphate isomerase/epimerase
MTDFSYQLYSSRNFPPLSDTLNMLGGLGYTQVEGYGGLFEDGVDLSALKASLDAAGVTMPTAHIDISIIRDRPDRAIEIARALGVKMVNGPYLQDTARPKTAAGWNDFGEMLQEAAQPLLDAGLVVGWHNHDFEFTRVEGHLPQNLMLAAAPDLKMELDVAWCVKGGEDPVAWINAHADRIVAAHIKDIAAPGEAADEDGWADVGHGTLDWAPIMEALRKTPCAYFIAEHDNPNDHKRFASRSLAAMQAF